jgi:hypothetical protein
MEIPALFMVGGINIDKKVMIPKVIYKSSAMLITIQLTFSQIEEK